MVKYLGGLKPGGGSTGMQFFILRLQWNGLREDRIFALVECNFTRKIAQNTVRIGFLC